MLTYQNADWNCPSIESRKIISHLTKDKVASFSEVEAVKEMVYDLAEEIGDKRYILPVWQNMEALILSSILASHRGTEETWIPGKYCMTSLDELSEIPLSMASHPMHRATLQAISFFKNEPLILEVESPFTILSALMDPMDLFPCFMEEAVGLKSVLHRIADAQVDSIRQAIEAGCRVISLADPVGNMNMVGEKYFLEFVGESELYLMKSMDPYLDKAIVHICKKTSQSLLIAGLLSQEMYHGSEACENYYEMLLSMASDPAIHYTGMTCIHDRHPNLTDSVVLKITETMRL